MRGSIFPEMLQLQLDDGFLSVLQEFLSKVAHLISWEEFGRISSILGPWNPRVFLRDLYKVMVRKEYGYLSYSPAQGYLLRRLSKRMGTSSRLLFSFLCLNEQVEEVALLELLGQPSVTRYIKAGLFIRREGKLILPVTLVPYCDYFYLSEALHLEANRDLYGIQPAHFGMYTHSQVVYLKKRLKNLHIETMLEMGCGVGIVSLEMSKIVNQVGGVEVYERSLQFAHANKTLRKDMRTHFGQSDLFSNVTGKYELIVFAPWIPSESSLGLIRQYLEEAPYFLTPNGHLMLLMSSAYPHGQDDVLNEVSAILRKQSLQAYQDIICSYYSEGEGRARTLRTIYYLWIEQRTGSNRVDYEPIHRNPSLKSLGFLWRTLFP